ncbi:MAG: thiamine diphosphokinase [Anaerolineae bacterium]|nr:thiamine diphosphokinase [Anaerolineae bacterium]MCO5206653.1 thiamine diphosphokinase [Anaerolineae bacterium]
MAVLVFANGQIDDVNWIRPYLDDVTAIIAADGGTSHLYRLDIRPNLVIGDLDSLDDVTQDWLTKEAVLLQQYPTAKDETDLELALLAAVRDYDAPLRIFGALGGRLDQQMANILLMAHPQLHGRDVRLVEQFQQAWLVTDTTTVDGEVGDTVSLIPLAGDVRVAETTGLSWELRDSVLAFGPARGVSNRLSAETATIILDSGMALCVHTQREWTR